MQMPKTELLLLRGGIAPVRGRKIAFYRMPRFTRRWEEHTSELQSLMRISYAVFCLKKNNNILLLGEQEIAQPQSCSSYKKCKLETYAIRHTQKPTELHTLNHQS